MALLLLASLPFLAKGLTLWLGLTGYLAQSSYKILQLLLPMCWYASRGRRGAEMLAPAEEVRPTPRLLAMAVLYALLLAGGGIVAIHLLLPVLQLDPAVLRAGFDARFQMGPAGAIAVVVFLSSLNAYLEEWHFRWWLDMELTRRWGRGAGIVVSATAFAGMHAFIVLGVPGIPGIIAPLMGIGLFVAGITWSLLLRRGGGFYAAWLSHGLTDALLLGWGLWWLGYL